MIIYQMAKIAENSLGNTFYDENGKIITIIFKGIVNEDKAQEHFVRILNFASKHKVKGILADLRNLRGTFMRFMEYFEFEAYPLLIKNGLKAEALIIPEDDLIIENLSDKLRDLLTKLNLKCEMFKSSEEANFWLLNQLRE